MRGSSRIHHRPYCPPIFTESLKKPYICRLAPFADGFEFEWFDHNDDGVHKLYYGERGGEKKNTISISDPVVTVGGLDADREYEFYIESESGMRSNTRLLRTGDAPDGCTVINYLHPEDGQYEFSGRFLCSPSLVRTKSGRIIAGMDLYGPKMPQNLTLHFYSEDNGKSWRYLNDIYPFYWSYLFCHKDVLYIFGLTTEYGNLQIAYSMDEGETWSAPVTLFYGSSILCQYGGFHRAPMQINAYNGRLYTSCEYGCWDMKSHLPAVLSIDENADLMVPENWVRSEFLQFDGEWKEHAITQGDTIEGNVVKASDGNVYNYMRWRLGSFLRLKVDSENPENPLEFSGIFDAPVSNSMFRVIPADGKYYLVTNRKTEAAEQFECKSYRNVLSIYESVDMEHFSLVKDVVNYGNQDTKLYGFQYPAYIYEEGELLLNIRSAFNGAASFHNTNYMLFSRQRLAK